MKLFAALAVATALHASVNAAPVDPARVQKAQAVCSSLAVAGRAAAQANAGGLDEDVAHAIWSNTVDENASPGDFADSLKAMGSLEISAVYDRDITDKEEGYWIGYQICFQALTK